MTKAGSSSRGRRRNLVVISSDGSRQRFLRGMITHDLVKRGIDFEDAYATAQTIRGQLGDRDEITTAELRDLIEAHLEALYGEELPAELRAPWKPQSTLRILYAGEEIPFSKGVLTGSIHAAGLYRDEAYRVASDLETALLAEGVEVIESSDLVRRVDALLEQDYGPGVTRRYRLVRRIHRLPRPLVIYIGGASGTGKSSLALEIAPMLRIYRVNATDTIRQVMRMIFTPAILPSLHRSTFETSGPGSVTIDDLGTAEMGREERWIANFDEQAARVSVGVRAVVERSIAENMSVIVEGVHLRPGIIPFPDLEGACYQVPLILGTLDREAHRTRFLSRMPAGERGASRYLEAFDAIRTIHDHLLQLSEVNDVPLLDTFVDDNGPMRAMRLIAGELERRVPALARADIKEGHVVAPTLLLAIDGLADRPVRALGGRTPLQAAETPNLDRLAAEGQAGLADPIAPGVVPDTAAGTLAMFGQSPQALKRGPVEAIGAGFKLRPDDIALRANLATADRHGNVIDRRAGRIREEAEELAHALDRLPLPGDLGDAVEVRVKPGTEHRLAIVLRGHGLSPAITGSDPGDAAVPGPPLSPAPADPANDAAVFTARVLAAFETAARKVLKKHPVNRRRLKQDRPPANLLLTRGAGRAHRLIPLEDAGLPLRVACVSGDRTVLGLAKILGARTVTKPGMTANLDTDLRLKFRTCARLLKENDIVLLHIKGADIAAHDRRPEQKAEFIERIDQELGRFLADIKTGALRVAVASDHATLSESGQHGADPLPVLIWGPDITADEVDRFDEQSVAGGELHRFPLQMLLGRLFELS